MNKEQWDQLKPGSIIRNAKSGRLRMVLKIGNAGGIYLTKVSGRGTTCYCTGDKNLWEPTGFKIKAMNADKTKI